jgi:lipopolysaccharide transport system ATP-binding protein
MALAIKVENLSKAYRLGTIGTGTLSKDIERKFAMLRGKDDPFNKLGENKNTAEDNNIVWSLKNINLEVSRGESVGVIGGNGAGKSTFLKVLSNITSPTTGSIKLKGRIASLLEVGTGFHPELTGRENIYLNGAILGMRKYEIDSKLDEILNFSEVEKYIDTPVKRYSSGMYVRLAFSVAAHLESEILIVDEVLAVGDTDFQKKCLTKMNSISSGEGKTVFFVSHNLDSVMSLCNKTLFLKSGQNEFYGDVLSGINKYCNQGVEKFNNTKVNLNNSKHFGNSRLKFISLDISPNTSNKNIYTGDDININLELIANDTVENPIITIVIYNTLGLKISEFNNRILGLNFSFKKDNKYFISYSIEKLLLPNGEYLIGLWAGIPNEDMDGIEYATKITILRNPNLVNSNYVYQGVYQPKFNIKKTYQI